MEIPATSNEFVRVKVSATLDGVDANIAGDAAEFAFMPWINVADPSSGDWVAGSMEQGLLHTYARILIGPTGETLAIGRYRVWVRITDNPEKPVRFVGILHIV